MVLLIKRRNLQNQEKVQHFVISSSRLHYVVELTVYIHHIIFSPFQSAHYIKLAMCSAALYSTAHVPAKCTMFVYDADTSDREHARLYQHICTLYCGPDVPYMWPSHSPPQDLSKSENGTEAGTHRNNPTITNHRPDDSHVSDTKIF